MVPLAVMAKLEYLHDQRVNQDGEQLNLPKTEEEIMEQRILGVEQLNNLRVILIFTPTSPTSSDLISRLQRVQCHRVQHCPAWEVEVSRRIPADSF